MLCVPFCFSKNQLVISESNITLEGGPSSQYISPTFDVTPGVYKVYISKGTGTGTVFCHTNEENKLTFHALRYNALHLSESTPYAETNIYVTSKINDVYIGYETSDSTSESISIEVYRTNIGMRILSTLLLLCFSLFDLILWFRKSIITKKSDTQQQIIVYGLSLGILTVFLPYLSGTSLLDILDISASFCSFVKRYFFSFRLNIIISAKIHTPFNQSITILFYHTFT